MAQWITVGGKDLESQKSMGGIPIEVQDGDRLPDVILINGHALTYRGIDDNGVPIYVVAKLYVWDSSKLPAPENLLPESDGLKRSLNALDTEGTA